MRSSDEFFQSLAILVWSALCTAVGLWLLPSLQPWPCGQCMQGHHHQTFAYKKNTAAYLEYGRRMRTAYRYQVRAMVGQNADLIGSFKKGEYARDRDRFEKDTDEFCNALLEFIQQFDGQQVPDVMEKSHAKIANCHRLCYESVQALREAYGAEGSEQVRLVHESEKKLKEAWTTGNAGVKLHDAIWAHTST